MSGQFWSNVFVWQDIDVDIDHGIVDVHVTFNGEDVADAPVYLFTASGTYLGRYDYTDSYGHAAFFIPAQSYKFRVDYESTQYWSDVVNVIVHEETDVEMPLEQLALNKTNDPNPIRYDGEPPVFEPEGIKVASIGSLAGILSQTVIANTTPPKVYYYLNDHLGTPQLMTDENNVVVWEAKYRPFGEAVVHPYSTVENNVRLPGQYFDQETGLHYNYHRYYDPRIGRYLTPDPSHSFLPEGNGIPYLVPLLLNMPQELNLYPYVQGDPINRLDQFGLQTNAPTMGRLWPIVRPALPALLPLFPILISPGTLGAAIVVGIVLYPSEIAKDECEGDDLHEHCLKLFILCDRQQWQGNCGQCFHYCKTQGEWDFLNCPPGSSRW